MKLQTRLLTAAASLLLAAVAQAGPGPGFTTNSQATIVTNGIMWSVWGASCTGPLTQNGTCSGGCNGFGILTPLWDGTADEVYGLRCATFFTNTIMGPDNNSTGAGYFAGSEAAPSISYADQSIGVFIPPTTGNYVFFICSDDYSELFLGTDIGAASAQLIAEENLWSNPNQWTASAGGSSLSQKRSDQFALSGSNPQYPNGVPLVAGNMYFIELNHENGNGGYNDEVYYKMFTDPDPNSSGSTATDMTNTPGSQVIGFVAQPPTFATVTVSPSAATNSAGSAVYFSASVASDGTCTSNGIPYYPSFVWQTNGTIVTNADGTVANGRLFSYIVGSNDNNVKVTCSVTIANSTFSNLVSTPASTITVTPASVTVGGLRREFWYNEDFGLASSALGQTSTNGDFGGLANFGVGEPSYTAVVTIGQGPTGTGIDNYNERYSGWFIPPTTGSYVFWVESDDYSELFISTDATPNNKYLIAQETEYANPYEWLTDEAMGVTAGTPITQKYSATFVPPGGTTAPYAAGISLKAGEMYYIEADHEQGGGGDNFAMTFSLLANEAAVTNGVPTAFGSNNIAYSLPPTTRLTFTQNITPTAATVIEAGNTNFSVSMSTDSALLPTFEWLVGTNNEGQGVVTGSGGNYSSSFYLLGVPATLNGAQIKCVVTIPTTSFAITSSVAALTVTTAGLTTVQGYLTEAWWGNLNLGNVPNTPTPEASFGPPYWTALLDTFQTPVNYGINYMVEAISGYFVAPETGHYVFYIASDDQSHLYLSTDDTGANVQLVAQVTSWDNEQQWIDSAGGSSIAQKSTDTFVNSSGQTPGAGGYLMHAGSNYFIEDVHYQGGGGVQTGVYFGVIEDQANYPTNPPDGTASDFVPSNIFFVTPTAVITLTGNPLSTTNLTGTSATFTASATSTGTIIDEVDDANSVIDSLSNSPAGYAAELAIYTWYTNGVVVAGATSSSYTTPLLSSNYNGLKVYATVTAFPSTTTNTSTTATLTVVDDTVAPTVTSVFSHYDSGGPNPGETPVQYVEVIFSKIMNTNAILNPANYTVTGATVTGAALFSDGAGVASLTEVILTLSAPLTGPPSVTFNTTALTDFSGVGLAASSASVTGTADPLSSIDISSGTIAIPGQTLFLGTGDYLVNASGADIWGNNDGFRFVYEKKTNAFDVVVQVSSINPADQWSKAGLMVREAIDIADGGARNLAIYTTASPASPAPLDGTGPEDSLSYGMRGTTDCNSTNDTSPGFVAGATSAPTYPNVWLRLTRTLSGTNDVFTGYYSTNGTTWSSNNILATYEPELCTNDFCGVNPGDTNFPSVVYVGMCTTAHVATTASPQYLATVMYQNFGDYTSVTPPPATNAPTLTATLMSPTTVSVSWIPGGGTLYSSPVLSTNSSSWSVVGTANPAVVPITGTSLFFEIRE
jgi:hypothetical protein